MLSSLAALIQLGKEFEVPYRNNVNLRSILQHEDGSFMLVNETLMQLPSSNVEKLPLASSSYFVSPEEWVTRMAATPE